MHRANEALVEYVATFGSCAVGFSGGVDSTVVAQAARTALADDAVAVTAVSPSLAAGQREEARRLASLIGIRHVEVATEEVSDPRYVRNDPQRCFFCKDTLYRHLRRVADRLQLQVLADGANADDTQDYRPGRQAAGQHHVRSPLAECHLTKEQVRAIARHWNLPVWDKPASPCLSSRIAYGQAVTPERLAMVDQAEQFLRSLGFSDVRVRFHQDELARLEVASQHLPRLAEPDLREAVVAKLKALGFRFVSIDLEGFRSGSLNQILPLDVLSGSQA